MIRLPRLTLQTRALKKEVDERKERKHSHATELAKLQDIEAENKMLHRIK